MSYFPVLFLSILKVRINSQNMMYSPDYLSGSERIAHILFVRVRCVTNSHIEYINNIDKTNQMTANVQVISIKQNYAKLSQ